jgi:5-methyltetrahydropteroyltriglutamate--homocysteine methyltransferase
MMYRREEGKEVDIVALHKRTKTAVREVVDKQRRAGLDIVNDGEMSKPSYATYIKDRLSGFGGLGNTFVYQDLVDFPNMAKRVFGDPGRSRRKTPACNAPIAVSDPDGVRHDIENLRAAVGGELAQRPFITAASPGVISLFFHNDHYPSEGAYLEAIAAAMKPEYEAIVAAGFDLQVDCPDLAMGRHIQYANLELGEFRKRAAEHVEALNGALENIPADRVRMHLCWGNYEGPHHCDVPLADIVDIVLNARPAMLSLEAANPRHAHEFAVFEKVKLPEGKALIPGVIESKSNFVEHPEVIVNASRTTPGWSASRTSSPEATAATAPGSVRPQSLRISSGRSSRRSRRAPAWRARDSGLKRKAAPARSRRPSRQERPRPLG